MAKDIVLLKTEVIEKRHSSSTLSRKEAGADDLDNPTHESVPSQILAGWRLGAVIISLALGMFLVGVDASIIGVTVPKITETFHSLDDIAWYGSAYLLPCTVLQPSFGWFFKSFNVTYIYIGSVVLFEGMSCLQNGPQSLTDSL
jgi:hypothetical protein